MSLAKIKASTFIENLCILGGNFGGWVEEKEGK